jgi:phosphatidylserine decarboxylase
MGLGFINFLFKSKSISKIIEKKKKKIEKESWARVISEFYNFILIDTKMRMLFMLMFEELLSKDSSQVFEGPKNLEELMQEINNIISNPPFFYNAPRDGLPLLKLLTPFRFTNAGFQIFLDDKVNFHLRRILRYWESFLNSPASTISLTTGKNGWFSEEALKKMPNFQNDFICDPSKPHWGFISWNDFFTRKLRPYARPVAFPNDDNVITNACEAAPFQLKHNIQLVDQFWIKEQPYSLLDIFGGNFNMSKKFVGGSIYQGFLSPFNFHRWNSPISGIIVDTILIEGGFYSKPSDFIKIPPGTNVPWQAYLACLNTRLLILIKADNLKLALVCVVLIGMEGVSSCIATVKKGQHVTKGQELGYFQFGGSSHCLIFQPSVSNNLKFNIKEKELGIGAQKILVNQEIARFF